MDEHIPAIMDSDPPTLDSLPAASGVYVLQLAADPTDGQTKYYVGFTTDLSRRVKQHFAGGGSAWTARYKPLAIAEIKLGGTLIDETHMTLLYMQKYGWQHVRGGPYVQVKMSHPPHEIEQTMSCYRCHGPHMVRNCPEPATPEPTTETFFSRLKVAFIGTMNEIVRAIEKSTDLNDAEVFYCERCSRKSHNIDQCYAKKHLDGTLLLD